MLPCMTLGKGHRAKNLYRVFFTVTRQRLNTKCFVAALGKEKVTSVSPPSNIARFLPSVSPMYTAKAGALMCYHVAPVFAECQLRRHTANREHGRRRRRSLSSACCWGTPKSQLFAECLAMKHSAKVVKKATSTQLFVVWQNFFVVYHYLALGKAHMCRVPTKDPVVREHTRV
jgi:hypothetical protein